MTPLATSTLGTTGLRLTRLGLGCAPIGGLFAPVSDLEARETVRTAWTLGIRFFDTAPLYGHGRSETRLGQHLGAYPRDEYVLATKVGRLLVPASGVPGNVASEYKDPLPLAPVFDFSRDGILRAFESSLERLQVNRVDILHLHDPDDHFEQALREALPVVMELKSQGVVRAVSAGMNQWQMLARFARVADFDCFLLAGRYTLLDQSAAAELLPLCVERGVSVIVGGPYNSGVLAAGSRGVGHYNYAPPPPEILQQTSRLEAVCMRHAVPLKAAALQFPLGHPAVVSVLAGARSEHEVAENVSMMGYPISPAFWQDLRAEHLVDDVPLPR